MVWTHNIFRKGIDGKNDVRVAEFYGRDDYQRNVTTIYYNGETYYVQYDMWYNYIVYHRLYEGMLEEYLLQHSLSLSEE